MKKRDAKRAAKLAGKEWVTKPRPKFFEDHHDGCGSDVSGIADNENNQVHRGEVETVLVETDSEPEPELDGISNTQSEIGLGQLAFFGPKTLGVPDVPHDVELLPTAQSLFGKLDHAHQASPGQTTFLEICSCSNGSGRIATRYGSQVHVEDATTTADLGEYQTQKAIFGYRTKHSPTCLVVTTSGQDEFLHLVAKRQLQS